MTHDSWIKHGVSDVLRTTLDNFAHFVNKHNVAVKCKKSSIAQCVMMRTTRNIEKLDKFIYLSITACSEVRNQNNILSRRTFHLQRWQFFVTPSRPISSPHQLPSGGHNETFIQAHRAQVTILITGQYVYRTYNMCITCVPVPQDVFCVHDAILQDANCLNTLSSG